MQEKTVEQSKTSIGSLMQPEQANIHGNVHGGEIMKLMDNVAGIAAMRHARINVVTARVDKMEFHQPIHIGNLVTCTGHLTFVGKSSIEVLVKVFVENLAKEDPAKLALNAYFTMVALDESGKPVQVPPLKITTAEEQKLFDEGQQRYLSYKEQRR